MNPWLDSLIQDARDGDTAAARALLGYMAECHEKGEEIPPALREYFTQAFKKIARGDKADDALSVEGADRFDRDYEIARKVWQLHHRAVNPLPLRSKHNRGACAVVADEYHLSAERVKQIYDDLRWLVEAEALSLEPDQPRPKHWPDPPEHKPELTRLDQRRKAAMKLTFERFAEAFKKRNPSG